MMHSFKLYSPIHRIRTPDAIPFSTNEHVWVRIGAGQWLEYIAVSKSSGVNSTGVEISLDPRTCVRTSPHARFVRVSAIAQKPCYVWVLDSESHVYKGGILSANDMFNGYELDKDTLVSTTPVYHSGYESGHIWTIARGRFEIFDTKECVIVENRPLDKITCVSFVRKYVGLDSDCEFTLNALVDTMSFSSVCV